MKNAILVAALVLSVVACGEKKTEVQTTTDVQDASALPGDVTAVDSADDTTSVDAAGDATEDTADVSGDATVIGG